MAGKWIAPRPGCAKLSRPDPEENEHGARVIIRTGRAGTRRFLLMRAILTGLGALALVGCPGMSVIDNERFRALVARTVSPGMPFVAAIEKLVKAGFSCDDQSSAPLVTCAKNRQSLLPYACFERVNLATDADRRKVTEVAPQPIACAGL
jgi:hypothetical protein